MENERPWSERHARHLARRRGVSAAMVETWMRVQKRVLFAETVYRDLSGAHWQPWTYQVPSLESRALRKVHCDGRDVGKTTELVCLLQWASVGCPGETVFMTSMHEVHVNPTMHRVLRELEANPVLAPNILEVRRAPRWEVRFRNGAQLQACIAGYGGLNYQGIHADWHLVDEAQNMSDAAWQNLFQALKPAGRLWMYGVPDGRRSKFYEFSQREDWEQWHWPSSLNVTMTRQREEELRSLYGGPGTPGYVHNFLGMHGTPSHAVFGEEDYSRAEWRGAYAHVTVEDVGDVIGEAWFGDEAWVVGVDLGFARDPSELVFFLPEADGRWRCAMRWSMRGVKYSEQEAVLEHLVQSIPNGRVCIDGGHAGVAVAHGVLARVPEAEGRLHLVHFGGSVAPEPGLEERAPRRRMKEMLTELLLRGMQSGEVAFGVDEERQQQYLGHTYHLTPDGRMVYSKGNDHIIDADRCAMYGIYLADRLWEKEPKVGMPPMVLTF